MAPVEVRHFRGRSFWGVVRNPIDLPSQVLEEAVQSTVRQSRAPAQVAVSC